jgi:hypothetical protein
MAQTISTTLGTIKLRPVFIHVAAWGLIAVGIDKVLNSLDLSSDFFFFDSQWLGVVGYGLIAIGAIAHLQTIRKLVVRTGTTFGILAFLTWVLGSLSVSILTVLSSNDLLLDFWGNFIEGVPPILLGAQVFLVIISLKDSHVKNKVII